MSRYFIHILLLFTCLKLPAQEYNVAPYSLDEGLHQSQVLDIMQDRRGYLWLGTHRGVSKFDGNDFQVYEPRNSEMLGNFVSIILEDKNGDIWVGTEEGLARYHPNTFKRYKDSNNIKNESILAMLEAEDGKLWIGSQTGNLYHYQDGKYLKNDLPWENKPAEISIRDLEPGLEGRIWIGTTKGLFFFEPKEADKGIQAFGAGDKMSDLEIFDIQYLEGTEFWIGTQKGLFSLNLQKNTYEAVQSDEIDDPNIFCLTKDQLGVIWIGTGKGLFRYKNGGFYEVAPGDRLLDVQVRTFLVDKEANTWIGTNGSGMRKITEGSFVKFNLEDGLISDITKSFLEDPSGNIWISSQDRGIDLFSEGEILRSYTTKNGLGGDDICTSFKDSQGNFWFASYNGSLTLYQEGNFTSFGKKAGLDCRSVYCINEDAQNNIWVGTDRGVFRKNGEVFERIYSTANGLISDVIYSLLPDSKGKLWVGTQVGLSICDADQITNISKTDAIGNNVITLIEDPSGRIWTGSAAGLGLFEEAKEGKYVKISGASGAQTVVSLLIESNQYLWIGTERGVFQLDLEKFDPDARGKPSFEYYAKKDGLPSLECNANAIFQDSKDNIWFGTAKGAAYIPAGIRRKEESFRPPVYITAVNSSISQDTDWSALGYELNERGLPQNLKLDHTDNRVDIDFIGLSLKSPQQVEYKIMMEGVDEDWVRPKSLSQSYPNLGPGQYTFKVTAKMETEPWMEDQFTAFSFEILPPFWQRWWFILPMSLLFLFFIYLAYLAFTYRRRQRQEKIRIQNTAEKLQLEHQALYAMMNPHFTFNALQSIQYFIHRQDKKAANKFLSSFAKLVRKNLESTKSDFISLNEELERLKLYLGLEKMRFPEKFDYSVESDPDIDLSEIQIPPMILQPFVENSIKHGIMPLDANGMIEVDLHKMDEDYLSISIKDNGIGIEASKKQHANRPNDHVSKGMQITLDRLKLFARMTNKKYSLDIDRKSVV